VKVIFVREVEDLGLGDPAVSRMAGCGHLTPKLDT
jgi:hypothetical protein